MRSKPIHWIWFTSKEHYDVESGSKNIIWCLRRPSSTEVLATTVKSKTTCKNCIRRLIEDGDRNIWGYKVPVKQGDK